MSHQQFAATADFKQFILALFKREAISIKVRTRTYRLQSKKSI